MRWLKWLLASVVCAAAVIGAIGGAAAQDPAASVVLDATGPIQPGASVEVTIDLDGAPSTVYILQCRTASEVCEYRAGLGLSDGVGSAAVTIRRLLLSPSGRANCSRMDCELRVTTSFGEILGAASIVVDPTATVARPAVTVDPAADLADRDTVEISGSGFDADSFVEFYQCTLLSCSPRSAYSEANSSGTLRYPAQLTVQRQVGTVDCAEQVCFVLGLTYGNSDALTGALLRFDPDTPPMPPATIEASPTEGLLHNQLITVSGSGFAAGEFVRAIQCVVDADGLEVDCASSHYEVTSAAGVLSMEVAARRRVGEADCASASCVLVVAGEFDRETIPLSFDGSVPPPPLPVVSVEPASQLVDHQMVTVTVDHVEVGDYVSVRECVVETGACRSSISDSVTEVPWRGSLPVVRDIGPDDCAIVACEIVVDVYRDDRLRLRVPVSFDPDGPRADPPSLRVLPSTGLWDGQRVELRVENVLPGDYLPFAQCPPGATSQFDCGPREYFFDDGDRSFVVHRTLGVERGGSTDEFDCGTAACEVVLFDPSNQRLDAVTLSFADGATPSVGYPLQLECVNWPTGGWPTGPVPDGVDPDELQAAIDQMLASDTDAVVVIHGGKLVGEGYDREMSVDSINRSFSVSKTFVGTVIGMLVDEGLLDLDAPAPVPEWSDPDDPRHDITLRHLMNMAPGLEWDESYAFDIDSDIVQMLLTPDSASYVAEKPLENEPGTVWHYSTGTTQILARIVSDTLDARSDDLHAELDERLFDVLGLNETVPVDASGVWRGGGWTDMSTRDFAKFGLLHLRGGVWEGEQLVSREWIEFMHEPSPAYAGYAGQIWRRGGFVEMVGLYGQKVTVRPDLDLVVASNTPTNGSGAQTSGIVALFESVAPASCSDEPVLVADVVSTSATVAVSVDVLANDPGRGSVLRADTLSVYDEPVHGTAEVVGGEVVYTPEVGFSGVEEFSYLVCTDAPYCGSETITVTVAPWGMSLRHADAVVMGSVLQIRVKAADAPAGQYLDPVMASVVEIECESGDVIGESEPAVYRTTHPSGLTYVRWTTDSGWEGCRRLVMAFPDGSELGADVTMLVPIP